MVIHPVSGGNTLWLFNIAMQKDPCIDDVPIQMCFSMAMMVYQRVYIHIAVYIHIQSYIYI